MHMQYKVDPEDALALPSFRSLYVLTGVVALLVALDLVFAWLGYTDLRNPLGLNLSLIAAVAGGSRIVYGALTALFEGDVGADLALAIAMVAAILLGENLVAAEVVLIASVGESLEALTVARTHREIHKILELRPRVVRVRRGDQEVEVPVEDVQVGEVIVIRPGERVPVDGTVLSGRSTVDQSTLTGESLPVDKGEGDAVFTGTLNQFGALEVRAEKLGDETTLGQVIQLVAEAQQRKAPVERTADRLARYFLPFVLACALVTFAYGNYSALSAAFRGEAAEWRLMPTLAVLVVACPCALILATPAAMMAALAWLAKRGVLIKGGLALERLAGVTRFAFDKTGTLTEGNLELGHIVVLDETEEHGADDVLALAAAAEQSSEHLIAKVIVRAAAERDLELPGIDDFLALPGAGVRARLVPARGTDSLSPRVGQVLVGNRRLMAEEGFDIPAAVDQAIRRLEGGGQTPLLVSRERRIVGAIGVRDTIRPEAAAVVRELRELGIEDIALVTGDRRATAAQVARAVGIERYEAELHPEEKARWLAGWRQERRTGRDGAQRPVTQRIAMVGDGVNDAPALASSDVGLALGGVGSDIAAEAGDLVLMGDPLKPLPALLQLARETVRVVRQNILLFAFFLNLLGVVLTGWVMPTWSEAWHQRSPVAAAVFHQIGSLLVLLNAMRLLWFERWRSGLLGRTEAALSHRAARVLTRLAPVRAKLENLWGRRRRLAATLAAILCAAYLAQGVVVVPADQVGVVQRFGRFVGTFQPGLHIGLPPPWQTVTKERPGRVRAVEIGIRRVRASGDERWTPIDWESAHRQGLFERREEEATMLTGDQSLVEVGVTIQYRIRDVRAYRFAVREPERVLRALVEGTVRQAVAVRPLLVDAPSASRAPEDILTTGRRQLEEEIRQRVQSRADAWNLGVEILPVALQHAHPPLAVVDAFRDVSSALKDRGRMKNEAEAEYRRQVIEAGGQPLWQALSKGDAELTDELWTSLRNRELVEGEAATAIHAAEAGAAERENLARGEAERFRLRQEAQEASPGLTKWRLYLETIAEGLRGREKLILEGRSGGRRHLLLGFPRGVPPTVIPDAGPETPTPED